jgi:hypothetical protein
VFITVEGALPLSSYSIYCHLMEKCFQFTHHPSILHGLPVAVVGSFWQLMNTNRELSGECFLSTHHPSLMLVLVAVGSSCWPVISTRSLVSVSTLTKWIYIYFSQIISFFNLENYYFSMIYYDIFIWVMKLFRV